MLTLTVVIPTYNRARLLERALRRLVPQALRDVRVEVLVVDNNSTDDTAAVAARFAPTVRYAFEPQQGLSQARNTGISLATGDIVAFTDDDVEVEDNWTGVILREFEGSPDVECIGGPVRPRWTSPPPAWLTRDHWAPLALQDHGERPRQFDRDTPLCLVGANFAFRRSVFDRVGRFAPEVQRVKDGIGSTEDHEFLLRLYDAGGRARYVPAMVVTAEVPAERLTAAYHRRWHLGHGRHHARMRVATVERTAHGRLFGVPAHLYRAAAGDAWAWMRSRLAGDRAHAFAAETRLWFFGGFLRERCPNPRR